MERLKILFITAWYPTKDHAVEGVFVREHAKAVRLYDDVVVLHCAGTDPTVKGLWRMEQESDESLTEGIPTYRVWHRRSPFPKTSYLIYLWSAFQAFRRIVAQGFQPDIIHAHIYLAGVPAVLIGKLNRIPVVVTEHSSGFPRKLLGRLDTWRARLAFKWADIVLPVSRSLQKSIEAYGIKARFRIVPNVVDTSLFSPQLRPADVHNPKRILFVGLLLPVKGLPCLLQALAQLRDHRDDWHLDIVGDGPARAEYERLAADLALSDKVTFHGLKTKREVAKFMRQSDICVLPSLCETFGIVAIEALATGTPVVATRSGGPEEFVTEDVGILVPPGDSEALYKGLDYILHHPQCFSCDTISRYTHKRFSPQQVGNLLHETYIPLVRT